MPKLLQGKIALVTGGGSGIGRATALKLAKEGAKVMIADYVPEGGERTVRMIEEAGGEASFVAADVSVTKQVEAMVAKTIASYGRIDCAFNKAASTVHSTTPGSKAGWQIRSSAPRRPGTARSRST